MWQTKTTPNWWWCHLPLQGEKDAKKDVVSLTVTVNPFFNTEGIVTDIFFIIIINYVSCQTLKVSKE